MSQPQVAILADKNTWHSQQLLTAFTKNDINPIFSDITKLTASFGVNLAVSTNEDIDLSGISLILVRHIPAGSLEQIIYRMNVLHQLEDNGVRCINPPNAIEKMVDKYYTSSLLAQAGLQVPETIVTENVNEALAAFYWLGGDVILKPLFGSGGVGMIRLANQRDAEQAFKEKDEANKIIYLQRFIHHKQPDFRTFMLGDQCVAAMERHSDNWKSNLNAGGIPKHILPSPEAVEISQQVRQILGADYCGVDFLPGDDGVLYVLEVNSTPGWRGLQSVSPIDISEKFVSYCLSQST